MILKTLSMLAAITEIKSIANAVLKSCIQNQSVDRSALKLNTKIEEYRALRSESLEAMKNQQAALSFGVAALGIIIGAGLNLWNHAGLIMVILMILIPLFCYVILVIWMGEVARMMRAGKYLLGIESYINDYFGEVILNWESWLRVKDENNKTPQLTNWLYKSIIALFLGIALTSILLGAFKGCRNSADILVYSGIPFYWIILPSSLLLFAAAFTYILLLGRKLEAS